MSQLDRPVWASLATSHAHLAEGGDLALRYRPDINVFASPSDEGPAALAALAALVPQGATVYVVQASEMPDVPGFTVLKRALAVQMLFEGPLADVEGREEIVLLGDADSGEMFALAALTEPGPYRANTHLMGRFVGVRRGDRLAAMAGERLRFPGHCEVSGICTHPDFRGQGLALQLTAHATATVAARRELPFLHAWKDNSAAISLYERLGYRIRCDMNVTVLRKS